MKRITAVLLICSVVAVAVWATEVEFKQVSEKVKLMGSYEMTSGEQILVIILPKGSTAKFARYNVLERAKIPSGYSSVTAAYKIKLTPID